MSAAAVLPAESATDVTTAKVHALLRPKHRHQPSLSSCDISSLSNDIQLTWLQKTTDGYPKLHDVAVMLDEMFWFAEFWRCINDLLWAMCDGC